MSDIVKGVIISVVTAIIIGIGALIFTSLSSTWDNISNIPNLQTDVSNLSTTVNKLGAATPIVGTSVTVSDATTKPNSFIFADCPSGSYVSGVAYRGAPQQYCAYCNNGIQIKCTSIK